MSEERKKLLLVEDDEVDRLAFERFVKARRLAYDYVVADSVSAARKVLESEKFETIITDFYLGDGDATDLLRMSLDSPVIVTTGAGSEETALAAIKAGAYDYLIKDAARNYLKMLPATVENAIRNKQTRDLLKRLQDSYRELYESVPIGLYRMEPGGGIRLANPRLLGMLGYGSFEDIADVNAESLFPDGGEGRRRLLGMVEESGGELRGHVFRLKKRDGGEITVRGNVKAMRGPGGETAGYEGAIDDISDQVKADEVLRMMQRAMEASLDGILITDPRLEGNPVIYCNPAFLRITGYGAEEVLQRNVDFLFGDDRDQDGVFHISEAVRGGSPCHVVLRSYTKDGALFWNEMSLAPVLNSSGELTNFVGIIKDVTERIRLDGELIKRQKLDSLSLLAGGIAHDLNNFLTTILLNISLALSLHESEDKVHTLLSNTEKACGRMQALTQQLLTFSKGGEPKKSLTPVESVISGALLLAPARAGIEYRVDVEPGLPASELDEGQMIQVLSNIIMNGVQAMSGEGVLGISAGRMRVSPGGGGTVWLKSGDYVRIDITDEGVGIPPHLLGRIFDPYFTTKKDGHGLGLAAAAAIIRNHGGDISAFSEPGAGTTFSILLKAAEAKAEAGDGSRVQAAPGKGGRILVIDDEPSVGLILKEMLDEIGYSSELVTEGDAGLALYRAASGVGKPFDAVVVDLRLNGRLSGLEVINLLREFDAGARIVASSGYFGEAIESGYERRGIEALLGKPFTMDDIVRVLASVIPGARAEAS